MGSRTLCKDLEYRVYFTTEEKFDYEVFNVGPELTLLGNVHTMQLGSVILTFSHKKWTTN